jgi:hypothetical protein
VLLQQADDLALGKQRPGVRDDVGKSAGIDARSNGVSGSSAAARTGSHAATFERTSSCRSAGLVYPAPAEAAASAAATRIFDGPVQLR